MDVKKNLPRKPHIHTLAKSLTSKLPLHLLSYPAVFATSFILSRAVFLGGSAPFGLAVSAALGAGKYSLLGLLGATFGYLSVFEEINSLKYIACLILVFTAHFVFSGTSLVRKKYFVPFSVIIPAFCINFVFLADGGFTLFDTALSFFEILISAISATFLRALIETDKASPARLSGALLALSFAFCASLSAFSFFHLVSPGRVLALLLILLCSSRGNLGIGAASGLLLGCSVSLSLSSSEYGIIFGICGTIFAAFFSLGKFYALAMSFISSACICACLNANLALSFLIEFPISTGLFLLLERPFSKHTRRFFIKSGGHTDIHLRKYITERLNCAANAFKSLGNSVTKLQRPEEKTKLSDVRDFFEKSTREFCKKCSLWSICWDRDFSSTRDAFTKAGNAITKNGSLRARDFPVYFSSRCLNTENFVNAVNREIFALRYRYQLDETLRESRELFKKQYSDISAVFSGLSSDLANNARFDEDAEAEIRDILTSRGILCETAVYRDSENHLNIHICGRDLSEIMKNTAELLPLFSKACEAVFSEPKFSPSKELDDIIIREKPRLRAVFGASAKSRSDASPSGDSGSFFYPSNGKVALLLSDGMGSGRLAAAESAGSINLLSDLLKSGLSPRDALSALQSVLSLRFEFTGSFSTLDLFFADLFTGQTEIYKLGGAPTYIKRGNRIRRITASSLPAGFRLGSMSEPEVTPLTLEAGDFIIMTSDGIADGNDDVKLLEFLSDISCTSPKALADEILAFSLSGYKKNDDMTVAVILIENEY